MQIENLTTKQMTAIEQALKTAVLRMGIQTTFKAEIRKNCNGDPFIYVESQEFQTFPVMFQRIKVTGEGWAKEKDDSLQLFIHLYYSFDLFGGGHNGCEIGKAVFCFFDDGDTLFNGLTSYQ